MTKLRRIPIIITDEDEAAIAAFCEKHDYYSLRSRFENIVKVIAINQHFVCGNTLYSEYDHLYVPCGTLRRLQRKFVK